MMAFANDNTSLQRITRLQNCLNRDLMLYDERIRPSEVRNNGSRELEKLPIQTKQCRLHRYAGD